MQADRVYSALNATETTETKIGTITIPATGINKIIGVCASIQQPTATAGELVSGYVRLAFKTLAGTFKFCATGVGGPAGTLAANVHTIDPKIIPVDINVPANETVDIYMAGDIALTGTCTGICMLLME
jgi:hypothetical protein